LNNISIPIYSKDVIRFNNLAYGEKYGIHLTEDANNTHGIKLNFSPKLTELPLNGLNYSQLQITIPNNITSNNYTLNVKERFETLAG